MTRHPGLASEATGLLAALPGLALIVSTLPAMALAVPVAATPTAEAAHGQLLYEAKCGGCHSIDTNRIGPLHRGVVGRKSGIVAGFPYSPGLKAAKIIWTPTNLDRWLAGPTRMVPGTRMGLSVAVAADRRDIIAYLTTQSAVR